MTVFCGSATGRTSWTITAVASGDWTMAGWVFPVTWAGALQKTSTAAGGVRTQSVTLDATAKVTVTQGKATTDGTFATPNNSFTTGRWLCLVGYYDSAADACGLYAGTLLDPMRPMDGTVTTGSGALDSTSTALLRSDSSDSMNTNYLGPQVFDKRKWSLERAEQFRCGKMPTVPDSSSLLVAYQPYTQSATVDLVAGTGSTTGTMTLIPGTHLLGVNPAVRDLMSMS